MKITPAKKDRLSGLTLIPVSDTPKQKNEYALGDGEWLIREKDGNRELFFYIDDAKNAAEMAHSGRLLGYKTSRFWGSDAAIDLSGLENTTAFLRGLFMADYDLGFSKTDREEKSEPKIAVIGIEDAERQIDIARIEAESQLKAMRLVDLPRHVKTPEFLGEEAMRSAEKYGYSCEVWDCEKIQNENMGALHAVGKGSENPPVFIICRYHGAPNADKTHLALLGKGITFDTGGLSIKPSSNMHYMKCDMAGGAAVLAAIELAARLKLPINLLAVVPSAENSVDKNAFVPGDILHSYSGKTIEIIDTDAEGRLALADALAWVRKNEKPETIIDMATLTGSSVRTLGYEAAALFTTNEGLSKLLFESGMNTGDKLWPLPLWKDYDSYIHSDVADVSNLPLKPLAGSIAAAKFLEVFADNHPAWAHIDMPGMAFKDSPFAKTKSGTGYGVQLFADFMRKTIAKF
ncbi:MAG TPA: leucyl aminopeptidase family protein [Cryomorphaceae bacterium]|nr:leucyl aminopeptidase family protein [Cryomorphaceae bacterium]